MHMLERFLFVVVHSSGDVKRGRMFVDGAGDKVSIEPEGRDSSPMDSFLSNFWDGIRDLFGDFR